MTSQQLFREITALTIAEDLGIITITELQMRAFYKNQLAGYVAGAMIASEESEFSITEDQAKMRAKLYGNNERTLKADSNGFTC